MTQLILNLSMLGSKPTGLGVYSEHCARALAERFQVGLIASPEHLHLAGDVIARAPTSIAIGASRFAAVRRQLWMRTLRLDDKGLVYSPTHHGLPHTMGQAITIHDLICLRFPLQHRPQYLFFRFGLPRLLKKCAAIFAVSETTRQDIADTYQFPLDRIFVVPNGVDASVFSAETSSRRTRPYLLMVGARYPHKNVEEVLENAELWRDDYNLIVTSCIGKHRVALEQKITQLKLNRQVQFLDYVKREELVQLYQNCSALIYPSKWEGFGIPPLEALACGSPVIVSDIPVHREILAESSFFVTLGDQASWDAALRGLRCSEQLALMRESAQRVLEKYTWKRSAEQLQSSLLAVDPRLDLSRAPATSISA